MTPLTSRQNPRVRWLRRLASEARARRQEGVWLVEGVRLADEVLRLGASVRLWVLGEGWGLEGGRSGAVRRAIEARGDDSLEVAPGLLRELADTETPQGILCAVEAPRWTLGDALAGERPVLVLDRLQDPGNLGTLARSAEAAGASGMLLTPGCVDPGNPKALRASAGSLLRLPVVTCPDPVGAARAAGRAVAATSGRAGVPYAGADLSTPFALLIGQEGSGIAPELERAADLTLTIPMEGAAESLNAATAAAVILFEAARQRGVQSPCP